MKKIFVVYCHPSSDSFTYKAKEAYIQGLRDCGAKYQISDLYAMKFNPVMSHEEYLREAFYDETLQVPEDVKEEQKKIEWADEIVFIFPNFWTSAPAMLEGWFQRVWTYGYAYGEHKMKELDRARFFMIMGGSKEDPVRQEQIESIQCSMIGDRMHQRAKKCEFYVWDEMTRGYGNDENRSNRIERFEKEMYQLAFEKMEGGRD